MALQCEETGVFELVVQLITGVLAIFFGIFVGSMAGDQVSFSPCAARFCLSEARVVQWDAVTTDTTGIETMQGWTTRDVPLMKVPLRRA